MKLHNAFIHNFSKGKLLEKEIYDLIIEEDPHFILLPSKDNIINNKNSNKCLYLYNLLQDHNYMVSSKDQSILVENDFDFNGNNSIQTSNKILPIYNNLLGDILYFAKTTEIKTVFLVYTQFAYSYIFWTPRTIVKPGEPPLYYDVLHTTTRNIVKYDSLFLDEGDLKNPETSKLYINNKNINFDNTRLEFDIPPIYNKPRVLTYVCDGLVLNGFGGRWGGLRGSEGELRNDRYFKGKIAAIMTFKNRLTENKIDIVNKYLMNRFISYGGVILLDSRKIIAFYDSFYQEDLFKRFNDDFYDIVEYNLLFPNFLNIGLTQDGVLFLRITQEIKTYIIVEVTNSIQEKYQFRIELEIVKEDDFYKQLPKKDFINHIHLYNVGVEQNEWEDSRKNGNILKQQNNIKIENNAILATEPFIFERKRYIEENFTQEEIEELRDLGEEPFVPSGGGNTLLFVFKQTIQGLRQFTDKLVVSSPDGRLWDFTPNLTPNIYAGRIQVGIKTYKLPLNEYFILIFSGGNFSFDQIGNLLGYIKVFIAWGVELTEDEIRQCFDVCSIFIDNIPQYVDRRIIEIFTQTAQINLNLLFSSPTNQPLIYTLVNNSSNFNIIGNILNTSFVRNYVGLLPLNVNGYSFDLPLKVEVEDNRLYINLQNNNINYNYLFLNDDKTITSNTWEEYNIKDLLSLEYNTTIQRKQYLKFKNSNSINFGIAGTTYFKPNRNLEFKSIILTLYLEQIDVYSVWFGNKLTLLSLFKNTILDEEFLPDNILTIGQNGKFVNYNQKIVLGFNLICLSYDDFVNLSFLSKDRFLLDRGIRGSIFNLLTFDYNLLENEFTNINTIIRNYYDPPREILLQRLQNNLFDETQTLEINQIKVNFSRLSKWLDFSLLLNSSYYFSNDELLAFRYEDFTFRFWYRNDINSNDSVNIISFSNIFKLTNRNSQLVINDNTSINISLNTWYFITINRINDNINIWLNSNMIYSMPYQDDINNSILEVGNVADNTNINYIEELVCIRRFATPNVEIPVNRYNRFT